MKGSILYSVICTFLYLKVCSAGGYDDLSDDPYGGSMGGGATDHYGGMDPYSMGKAMGMDPYGQ